MKLSIMQPYIFPYLGYFQLLHASDIYVNYSEAQFRKGGYINRNRLSINGQIQWFTVPLEKGRLEDSINEKRIASQEYKHWSNKFLKTFRLSYGKALNFDIAFEILNSTLTDDHASIGQLASASIKAVAEYLNLDVIYKDSPELNYNTEDDAQSKVIQMCNKLEIEDYINLPGGKYLYNEQSFKAAGLTLRFIEPQFDFELIDGFDANFQLSILDLIAKLPLDILQQQLSKYSLTQNHLIF